MTYPPLMMGVGDSGRVLVVGGGSGSGSGSGSW